jgi:hypothetical protein
MFALILLCHIHSHTSPTMKTSSIAQGIAIFTAFAASSSLARPALVKRTDGASQCKSSSDRALLKYIDYTQQSVQGTVLAEGTLSVSNGLQGNTDLIVNFFDCDFDFMGYTQGSSRNSGGSMGAPLEYFGHVTRPGDTAYCLTATPSDPALFRFQLCSYEDDDIQLSQWFARQIQANGNQVVAFVGAKNSTSQVYNGPESWTIGEAHGAFPPPVEATKSSTAHSAALQLYTNL